MSALCVIIPACLLIGFALFAVVALCKAAARGDKMIEEALKGIDTRKDV